MLTGADGKVDPEKLKELNKQLGNANLPTIPETATQEKPPAQEAEPPVQEAEPPAQEAEPPAQEAEPSAQEAEPPAPKPPLEKAQETAPKVPVKSVDEYINELVEWMVENGIITEDEAAKYLVPAIAGMYVGTATSTLNMGGETSSETVSCAVGVSLTDEASRTYSISLAFQGEVVSSANAAAKEDKNTGIVNFDATFYIDGIGLTFHITINKNHLEATYGASGSLDVDINVGERIIITATKQ